MLIKQRFILLHKLTSFLKLGLKNILIWKFPRLPRFGTFFVLALLAFTLSICSVALGQAPIQRLTEKINNIPISQPSDETSVPEIQNPNFTVSNTIGDIVYAPVKLDGYKLFDVASQLVLNQEQRNSAGESPPIEIRVQHIENALKTILQLGDRETLEVKVVNLNGRIKVVASDQNVLHDKPIVTVTDLDAQLYGIAEPELAEEAKKIVYQALIRAWSEREPEYLQKQSLSAIKIGIVMLVVSSILMGLQFYLKAQWRRLTERAQSYYQRERSLITRLKILWPKSKPALNELEPDSIVNSDSDQESEYAAQRDELLTNQEQQNRRKLLRNRNFFLRRKKSDPLGLW